jgi:hypothetical protein
MLFRWLVMRFRRFGILRRVVFGQMLVYLLELLDNLVLMSVDRLWFRLMKVAQHNRQDSNEERDKAVPLFFGRRRKPHYPRQWALLQRLLSTLLRKVIPQTFQFFQQLLSEHLGLCCRNYLVDDAFQLRCCRGDNP